MTRAIRPHIGLAASNVDKTVAFYRALFGIEPSKVKPGYAKFEVETPALNLSINAASEVKEKDVAFHMGIEVEQRKDVDAWKERVEQGGIAITLEEIGDTCCYAVQDKFWVADPDGHRWEIFMVHADAEVHTAKAQSAQEKDGASEEEACCAPTCCA